jgi:hypothetical protein
VSMTWRAIHASPSLEVMASGERVGGGAAPIVDLVPGPLAVSNCVIVGGRAVPRCSFRA